MVLIFSNELIEQIQRVARRVGGNTKRDFWLHLEMNGTAKLADLVNSPRMGMCGYVGPAEPPY